MPNPREDAPELPEPAMEDVPYELWGQNAIHDALYTADQLRAYGRQCADAAVAQERERAARVCEALRDKHCAGTQTAPDPRDRCNPGDEACDFVAAWNDAAAAIRSGD